MKKIKLVIFCKEQFGYHIETFQYAKYLKDIFDITYFCGDYHLPKQKIENVNVIYISRKGNIFQRNIRFIFSAINYIKKNDPDICFIKYFRGCFLLKIFFFKKKFIFDIRSGNVEKSFFLRFCYDNFMKFESKFFSNITVISESLANKLHLKKYYILPLGSDIISKKNKNFDVMHLIYVGTLDNRDIYKTILGFIKFYKEFYNTISLKYTIIGKGSKKEEDRLKRIIMTNNLSNVIQFIGYVPFNKLEPYFDEHNIGVSFIPITPYYNFQPPTKTFDYLLSGMAVIATNTYENRKVITKFNGVLIDDTIDGFYKGLIEIYKNREIYNSAVIRNNMIKYKRENICDNLKDYIFNILSS